jgi:hypothetical protein
MSWMPIFLVDEQHGPYQIAAGQQDGPHGITNRGLPDEPTPEISDLSLIEALVYLCQCADKYQQQSGAQQYHREPKGTEKFEDAVNHWGNERIARTW